LASPSRSQPAVDQAVKLWLIFVFDLGSRAL